MAIKKKRVYRKVPRTAAQAAREKVIRERFQRDKPSLDELVESGEYSEPISQGEYLAMMVLAAEIRKVREERRLSLAEVAKRSGIGKAALSRLENGKADNPTISTLARVAASVGKRIRIVLEDAPTH